MATKNFTNPRARFADNNYDPLTYGSVEFYEAGTNTPKDVFTTAQGNILNANPNPLDGAGYVTPSTGVHLGEGLYDIIVKDRYDAVIWTYPDIEGATGSNISLTTGLVETIQELRNLPAGAFTIVHVMGYYAGGDGGGRWMQWKSASTGADNGGTIIPPASAPAIGRWEWMPLNGDDSVTPQLFGALPSDGSLVIASEISSMINWCLTSEHKTIEFNLTGDYYINSSSDFSGNLNVVIHSDVRFINQSGFATTTFSCQSLEIKGTGLLVDPNPNGASMDLAITVKEAMDVYATWWGADPASSTLSSNAFSSMTNNISSNHRIIIDGEFRTSGGSLDFSKNVVLFKSGATYRNSVTDLIFNEVYSESNTPALLGSFGNMKFTGTSCDASIIDWAPNFIVNDDINDFIALNTENGVRNFRFIVDVGSYQFQHACDAESVGQSAVVKFIWDLKEGCNILTTGIGKVDFGVVLAGDYRVFNEYSVQYSMRFFQDQKIQWFGAVANDPTKGLTNANAFVTGISMNSNSNRANNYYDIASTTLELDGSTFYSEAIYVDTVSSGSVEAYMSNGRIRSIDLLASEYAIDVAYGLTCDRINIQIDQDGNPIINVREGDAKILNCKLRNKWAMISCTEDLIIEHSELELVNTDATNLIAIGQTGTGMLKLLNNKFNRNYISTTGSTTISSTASETYIDYNTSKGFTFNAGGAGSISDNSLDRASLLVVNPANIKIDHNRLKTSDDMDAKILLSSAISGFTVSGVSCRYNTFVDGVSNPSTRADYIAIDSDFVTANIAWAEVHSNYINEAYLFAGTTKFDVELDHLAGQTDWLAGGFYLITLDFAKSELTATQRYFAIFINTSTRNATLSCREQNGDTNPGTNTGLEWWKIRQNSALPRIDLDFIIGPNNLLGDLIFTCETTNLNGNTNAKTIPNPQFP